MQKGFYRNIYLEELLALLAFTLAKLAEVLILENKLALSLADKLAHLW